MDSNLDSKSVDPAVSTENITSEKSAEKSEIASVNIPIVASETNSSFSHNNDTKAALPAETTALSDSISASIESLEGPSPAENETSLLHTQVDKQLVDPSSIVEEKLNEEQLEKIGIETFVNDPDTGIIESESSPLSDPPSESVVELPNRDIKAHSTSSTAVETDKNDTPPEVLIAGELVVEPSIDEVDTEKIIEKSGVEIIENCSAATESTEAQSETVTEAPKLDTSMEQLSQEPVKDDASVVIESTTTGNLNPTSIESKISVENSLNENVLDENVKISVLDVNEGVEVQKVDEAAAEPKEASSAEQQQHDPTSATESGTPEAVVPAFVKDTVSDEQSENAVADVSDAIKEPTAGTQAKSEVAEPNEETVASNDSADISEPDSEISLPAATVKAPASDAFSDEKMEDTAVDLVDEQEADNTAVQIEVLASSTDELAQDSAPIEDPNSQVIGENSDNVVAIDENVQIDAVDAIEVAEEKKDNNIIVSKEYGIPAEDIQPDTISADDANNPEPTAEVMVNDTVSDQNVANSTVEVTKAADLSNEEVAPSQVEESQNDVVLFDDSHSSEPIVKESLDDAVPDEAVEESAVDVTEKMEQDKLNETSATTPLADDTKVDTALANEPSASDSISGKSIDEAISDDNIEDVVDAVSDVPEEQKNEDVSSADGPQPEAVIAENISIPETTALGSVTEIVAEDKEEGAAGVEATTGVVEEHDDVPVTTDDASLTIERQPDVLSANDISKVETIAQEANESVIEENVVDAVEVEDITKVAGEQNVEDADENNDDALPVETPQQNLPAGESSIQESAVEPVDVPVTEEKVETVVGAVSDAAEEQIAEVALTKEDILTTKETQPEGDSAEESNLSEAIVSQSADDAGTEEQVETTVEAGAKVLEEQDVEVAVMNENTLPTEESQPSTVSDEKSDTLESTVEETANESVSEIQNETLVEAVTEGAENQTVDEVSVSKAEDSPTEVLEDAVSAEQANSPESIAEKPALEPLSEQGETPVEVVTDLAKDEPVLDQNASQNEILQFDPLVAEVTNTFEPPVAECVDAAVSEENVESVVDVATETAEQQLVDEEESPTGELEANTVSTEHSNNVEPLVVQSVDAIVLEENVEQTVEVVAEIAEDQVVDEISMTKEGTSPTEESQSDAALAEESNSSEAIPAESAGEVLSETKVETAVEPVAEDTTSTASVEETQPDAVSTEKSSTPESNFEKAVDEVAFEMQEETAKESAAEVAEKQIINEDTLTNENHSQVDETEPHELTAEKSSIPETIVAQSLEKAVPEETAVETEEAVTQDQKPEAAVTDENTPSEKSQPDADSAEESVTVVDQTTEETVPEENFETVDAATEVEEDQKIGGSVTDETTTPTEEPQNNVVTEEITNTPEPPVQQSVDQATSEEQLETTVENATEVADEQIVEVSLATEETSPVKEPKPDTASADELITPESTIEESVSDVVAEEKEETVVEAVTDAAEEQIVEVATTKEDTFATKEPQAEAISAQESTSSEPIDEQPVDVAASEEQAEQTEETVAEVVETQIADEVSVSKEVESMAEEAQSEAIPEQESNTSEPIAEQPVDVAVSEEQAEQTEEAVAEVVEKDVPEVAETPMADEVSVTKEVDSVVEESQQEAVPEQESVTSEPIVEQPVDVFASENEAEQIEEAVVEVEVEETQNAAEVALTKEGDFLAEEAQSETAPVQESNTYEPIVEQAVDEAVSEEQAEQTEEAVREVAENQIAAEVSVTTEVDSVAAEPQPEAVPVEEFNSSEPVVEDSVDVAASENQAEQTEEAVAEVPNVAANQVESLDEEPQPEAIPVEESNSSEPVVEDSVDVAASEKQAEQTEEAVAEVAETQNADEASVSKEIDSLADEAQPKFAPVQQSNSSEPIVGQDVDVAVSEQQAEQTEETVPEVAEVAETQIAAEVALTKEVNSLAEEAQSEAVPEQESYASEPIVEQAVDEAVSEEQAEQTEEAVAELAETQIADEVALTKEVESLAEEPQSEAVVQEPDSSEPIVELPLDVADSVEDAEQTEETVREVADEVSVTKEFEFIADEPQSEAVPEEKSNSSEPIVEQPADVSVSEQQEEQTEETQSEAVTEQEFNISEPIVEQPVDVAASEEEAEQTEEAVAEVAEVAETQIAAEVSVRKEVNSLTEEPQPEAFLAQKESNNSEPIVEQPVDVAISEQQPEQTEEAVPENAENQISNEVFVTKEVDSLAEEAQSEAAPEQESCTSEPIVEQAVDEAVSEEQAAQTEEAVADVPEVAANQVESLAKEAQSETAPEEESNTSEPVVEQPMKVAVSEEQAEQTEQAIPEVVAKDVPEVAETPISAEVSVTKEIEFLSEESQPEAVSVEVSNISEQAVETEEAVVEVVGTQIADEASVSKEVESIAEEAQSEAIPEQESNTSEPIVEQPVDVAVSEEQAEQTEEAVPEVAEVAETQIADEDSVTKEVDSVVEEAQSEAVPEQESVTSEPVVEQPVDVAASEQKAEQIEEAVAEVAEVVETQIAAEVALTKEVESIAEEAQSEAVPEQESNASEPIVEKPVDVAASEEQAEQTEEAVAEVAETKIADEVALTKEVESLTEEAQPEAVSLEVSNTSEQGEHTEEAVRELAENQIAQPDAVSTEQSIISETIIESSVNPAVTEAVEEQVAENKPGSPAQPEPVAVVAEISSTPEPAVERAVVGAVGEENLEHQVEVITVIAQDQSVEESHITQTVLRSNTEKVDSADVSGSQGLSANISSATPSEAPSESSSLGVVLEPAVVDAIKNGLSSTLPRSILPGEELAQLQPSKRKRTTRKEISDSINAIESSKTHNDSEHVVDIESAEDILPLESPSGEQADADVVEASDQVVVNLNNSSTPHDQGESENVGEATLNRSAIPESMADNTTTISPYPTGSEGLLQYIWRSLTDSSGFPVTAKMLNFASVVLLITFVVLGVAGVWVGWVLIGVLLLGFIGGHSVLRKKNLDKILQLSSISKPGQPKQQMTENPQATTTFVDVNNGAAVAAVV